MTTSTSNLMYFLAKLAARLPLATVGTRIRLLSVARRHQILRRGGSAADARSEEQAVARSLGTAAACLDEFRRLETAAGRPNFPRDATRLRVRGDSRPDATTLAVARLARSLGRTPTTVILAPEAPSRGGGAFFDRLISAVAARSPGDSILVVGRDLTEDDRSGASIETRDFGDLPASERPRALEYLVRALLPDRLIAFDEGAARVMLEKIGPALSALLSIEIAVPAGGDEATALMGRWPRAARFWLAPAAGDGIVTTEEARVAFVPL